MLFMITMTHDYSTCQTHDPERGPLFQPVLSIRRLLSCAVCSCLTIIFLLLFFFMGVKRRRLRIRSTARDQATY